jgi:putative ABC transport system permease protein
MYKGNTTLPWIGLMAWRDSRGSRSRLVLATTAITFGVAAFVAISSFRVNVQDAVNQQAKSLLGADLVISSSQPFSSEAEEILASIGGEQSREVNCASMAYLPKSEATRLVNVRALAGDFPFYGFLEAAPREAAQMFRSGLSALVDDSLLLQFDAQVGDPIKIGDLTLQIVGRLKKIPGEAAAASLIGPRVYIPMAVLPQTGLLQKGSRVTYKAYFRLPTQTDVGQLLAPIEPQLDALRLESDTVEKRAARVGRVMDNLARFLSLVGFLALLLGGIGVASTMHVHMKAKLQTVALLHCVGVQARRTFAIYLLQAVSMGLIGGLFGTLLGMSIQTLIPTLLRDVLPVKIAVAISWSALLQGFLISIATTLLFALLPLLTIRQVSPLLALRSAYENDDRLSTRRDPLRLVIIGLTLLSVAAFAFAHTERWKQGLWFCLGLALTFGSLALVAQALIIVVRRYFPSSWPYVWRQGLANLHRPHNQTQTLILSLGAGTFFLMTLYLLQQALLQQVIRTNDAAQPNLVLFDIQNDQREKIRESVRSLMLPVLQDIPLVTMRLSMVKGRDVADLRNDKELNLAEWALQWEYRATYRDHLLETERLTSGVWQGRAENGANPVPISLEEEVVRALKITIGDELVFDVQGVPITAIVGSIRKVDWQRVQTNFFVVFPVGVLESAPQTYALVTKTTSAEQSAALQRTVIQQYSNISAIDLSMLLQTVETILQRISFAVRFMAFFSIAAGLVVLLGAVLTTRAQRRRENALLRVLGASSKQIRQILAIEYLFIGGFAGVAGLLLALIGSWAITYYLFEVTFVPTARSFLIALGVVIVVTMLTGMLGSRGVTTRSPLEVLRSEG